MGYKTCKICGGRGRITDYSTKIQTSTSYYKYGERDCDTCHGTGKIQNYDSTIAPKAFKNTPSKPRNTNTTKKSTTSEQQIQGVLALIGFLAGAILTYKNTDENLVLSGVIGVVLGYLAGKWYKAIIIIITISVILYLMAE